MPVLEPVVAVLTANTAGFTAGFDQASSKVVQFRVDSEATTRGIVTSFSAGAAGVNDSMRSIQRETEVTTAAVKEAGRQAEKAGSKFSLMGALAGTAKGPLGELVATTEAYAGAVDSAAAGTDGLAGAMLNVLKPLLIVGAVFAAISAFGVHFAEQLQTADNKIAASEDISTEAAKKIGDEFLTTAGKTTYSAAQIANAFAGVAGQAREINGKALTAKQSLELMQGAMAAAEATGGSLDSTTSAITKTIQAFQLSIGDAGKVSDILTTASRMTGQGVTTLGTALGRAKAQMGAASPPLQDLSALMVDLTEHGITGRAAIGALGAGLGGLAAPTDKVKAAQQALGISFLDAQGRMKPMSQVIDTARGAIKDMTKEQGISELKQIGFGSSAKKYYDTIMAGSAAYDRISKKVTEHGAAEKAAEKATSGFKASMEKAKSGVEDIAARLGNLLMPALSVLAQAVASAAAWVEQHWPEIQSTILGVVNAVKPYLVDLGHAIGDSFKWLMNHKDIVIGILAAIGVAITAFAVDATVAWAMEAQAAIAAWAATLGPIDFVIAGIMLVALAVGVIIQYWKPISGFFVGIWHDIYKVWAVVRDWFIHLWQDIYKAVAPALKPIAGVFADIGRFIMNVFQGVKNVISVYIKIMSIEIMVIYKVWKFVFDMIVGIVKTVWPIISGIIKVALSVIVPIVKGTFDVVIGILKIAFGIITTIFKVAWDIVVGIIRFVFDTIVDVARVFFAIFTGNWSAAWNAIKNFFQQTWNAIKTVVMNVFNAIKDFIVGTLHTIASTFVSVWNSIFSFLSGLFNAILGIFTGAAKWLYNIGKDILTGMFDGIKDAWDTLWSWITGLAKVVEDGFIGASKWLFDIGKKIIGGLWDGLKAAWHDVTGWLGNVGGWITDLKGPPAKDAILLTENGRLIMQGFGVGLKKGWNSHVAPVLSDMTTSLSGGFTSNVGLSLPGSTSGAVGVPQARGGGGSTTIAVTTPIQIDGHTIATTVTKYQLQNARATGNVLGQYAGGSQTATATGVNVNAVSR